MTRFEQFSDKSESIVTIPTLPPAANSCQTYWDITLEDGTAQSTYSIAEITDSGVTKMQISGVDTSTVYTTKVYKYRMAIMLINYDSGTTYTNIDSMIAKQEDALIYLDYTDPCTTLSAFDYDGSAVRDVELVLPYYSIQSGATYQSTTFFVLDQTTSRYGATYAAGYGTNDRLCGDYKFQLFVDDSFDTRIQPTMNNFEYYSGFEFVTADATGQTAGSEGGYL